MHEAPLKYTYIKIICKLWLIIWLGWTWWGSGRMKHKKLNLEKILGGLFFLPRDPDLNPKIDKKKNKCRCIIRLFDLIKNADYSLSKYGLVISLSKLTYFLLSLNCRKTCRNVSMISWSGEWTWCSNIAVSSTRSGSWPEGNSSDTLHKRKIID